MKDKTFRTHSRRRSYGKKLAERPGQKQRAIERARIREVKAVDSVQKAKPIETEIPWRAPRSKPDPGTYACRTIAQGCVGCFLFVFAFISMAMEPAIGLFLLPFALIFIIMAAHSLTNSRGGW